MEVPDKLAKEKQNLQLCEHCEFENVTTNANGICRDCGEYMCVSCFRNHLKGKRNRNHELVNVIEPVTAARKSAEEVEKCKQHDNEAIKFYCRKHDIVGCGDCIILEHSTCKPEYIKDLSKNIHDSEEFINLKRKIEELEHERNENFAKIRNIRKDFVGMHEEVFKKIRKFRTDVNIYLDKAEAAIITEVKKLMSDNDNILDRLEDNCNMLTSKIENFKQTLDTTVHKETVLFIQTVLSKSRVLETEQELSKYEESECKIKRYDFVPDQQLCSIIESTAKLGSFNISNIITSKRKETAKREAIPREPIRRDRVDKVMMPSAPSERYTATDGRQSVVVGARVQDTRPLVFSLWESQGQPGTVTAVHPDGTVDVMWDATEITVSGYSVGMELERVDII